MRRKNGRLANAPVIPKQKPHEDFLAQISHELRNPLATMNNAVAILSARCANQDREIIRLAGIIEQQVGRVSGLIDELLKTIHGKPDAIQDNEYHLMRSEEPADRRIERVLVVDDDIDQTQTLGKLLTLLGYRVTDANDGWEAVQKAGEFKPDAVLLDIDLPIMDGYQVAQHLRADKQHQKLLLIALSGFEQEADIQEAKQAGFDHYLVKPVNPDTLCQLLQDC